MKMTTTTEPPKQEESVAAMLKQLLSDKNQCMAVPKPDDAVTSLQKQLTDITSKLANITNSNSRAGTNTNGGDKGGRGGKYVKKEVTFNMFCSSCGVNYDHENDNCPPAKRQSWHKNGANWNDKKGGNTSKDHMWGKTRKISVFEKN